jgi:helix-turn-helix protein
MSSAVPGVRTRAEMFAADLRKLRTEAGSPSFRMMSAKAHYAPSTLAEATRGVRMPSRAVVEAFARACDADPADWALRWKQAATPPSESPTQPPYRRLDLRVLGLSVASGLALALLLFLGKRSLAGCR